ncbi:MAG: SAM hydrolase/SAM-dependent halogenase family protein [Bacteroidota bacterium]
MNLLAHLAGKSKSPVIALLTDFGQQDHYVGVMKGVILSINSSANIVDVSHDVRPQQIREGGYLLWAAYKFFPRTTIFVAVVDPGVGGSRRILGVSTERATFLAPDNMLLDFILAEETVLEAVEIHQHPNPYTLPVISSTFHGRDIFAPLAAHLSRGIPLASVGKPIAVHRPMSPFIDVGKDKPRTAEILHVDRFGNIITNLRTESIEQASALLRELIVGKSRARVWTTTYEQASPKTPCLSVGSNGLIEIVVKDNSAMKLLKTTVGGSIRVLWQ